MQYFWRELIFAKKNLKQFFYGSAFFVIMLMFFPMTMEADKVFMRSIAPGIVWIASLLSLLFIAEDLFQQDYDDGVLEQYLASSLPILYVVYHKIIVSLLLIWVLFGCLSPIFLVLLHLTFPELLVFNLSFIAASPALLCICALAAVLVTGLKQKGAVMAIIILPLTVPIMIFGSVTMHAFMAGQEFVGLLALLAAMSCLSLAFIPYAISGIISSVLH
jgi:heme exporter protein B